jgi:hypothetical protein
LLGYGFALEDNPHDSVSLRPRDSGSRVYSITRANPLPPALVAKVRSCQRSILEILAPFESKRNAHVGYGNILYSLSIKMAELAGDIVIPTEAGQYAAIHRKSERDLYILQYEAAKKELDKNKDSARLITVRLPREDSKRRKKTEEGQERAMIKWLCAQFYDKPPTKPNITTPESLEIKSHLTRLKSGFYDRVDWLEWDNLSGADEPNWETLRSLYKKFKKVEGIDISLDTVRIAWQMWIDEFVEIYVYPDAKEAFERFAEDKDGLIAALQGERVDHGIFIEEIPNVDRKWTGRDLVDLVKRE